MSSVITVENLGKMYLLSHNREQQPYVALRDVISDGVKNLGLRLLGRGRSGGSGAEHEEFWALKDVSFDVKKGDRIGIIGRNGAGKSTLLKILSRITEPTTGSVRIKGRVASLLEVGTGFHPELTGRENIFLNGAILGMSSSEIRVKFDEIVDFAEIEKFLDTPVKRYSSGMYVRLAFAVAAHLEPEILVVDEVLAVGDAQFQRKCLGKMENLSKGQGRTVIFVSHSMPTVKLLCNKAVLMENGRLRYFSDTDFVIQNYLSENICSNSLVFELDKASRSAGKQKAIKRAWLENSNGELVNKVAMGSDVTFCFEYELSDSLANPDFGFGFETKDGTRIFSVNTKTTVPFRIQCAPKGVAKCLVQALPLMPGRYLISLAIVDNQVEWVDYLERALSFEVLSDDVYGTGKIYESSQGVIFTHSKITVSSSD